MLLAQGAASEQDAFATLTAAAQQAGRPVQDVARALVAAVAARNTRAAGA